MHNSIFMMTSITQFVVFHRTIPKKCYWHLYCIPTRGCTSSLQELYQMLRIVALIVRFVMKTNIILIATFLLILVPVSGWGLNSDLVNLADNSWFKLSPANAGRPVPPGVPSPGGQDAEDVHYREAGQRTRRNLFRMVNE